MQSAAAAFNKLNRYKPSTAVNIVTADITDADATLTLGLKKTVAVADDWTIINFFKLSYKASEYAGIKDVNPSVPPLINPSNKCHDLSGREIKNSKLPRGIYIVNGQKVVVR